MGLGEPREVMVAGRRAVRELLRSGRPLHRLYVAESAEGLAPLVSEARRAGVPVQRVPRGWLDRACGGVAHQGIAAATAVVPYTALEELLERLIQPGGRARVLVLDHLQDPQNLGSLVRTADAAGVGGVVVPSRRAAGLTGAVWRASAGAVAHVPVARVASVAAAMETLKGAGFWLVGADPEGERLLWEVDLTGRVGMVVGAEGRGLSPLVRRRCDVRVRIPLL
ncbi:MAG TPA: 23S rRNA (guanosine(2251)-2'-O)-methyltransferase RlmB, partial [Limnochordales bacterium]